MKKTLHSYAAGIYQQQGLLIGKWQLSSSALRDSSVWVEGVVSARIFQGGYKDDDVLEKGSEGSLESLQVISRRGGHSIVMDDGDIYG
jgi:hypothetical protein